MDLTLVLCTIISLGLALAVVYRPLMQSKESRYYSEQNAKLHRFDPKVALLEAISELEQDHALGHLSQEEFDRLSLEYKREYLEQEQASAEKA